MSAHSEPLRLNLAQIRGLLNESAPSRASIVHPAHRAEGQSCKGPIAQNPARRRVSYAARPTLIGVAFAPSCINDERNVIEARQVTRERVSSPVSRYVRFVAPVMGEPLRSHT